MYKLSLAILTGLVFFLTACASKSASQAVSSTTGEALSAESQLVLGTLRLDGSGQAVSADQANELLVMWQVYRDLISSGTAAQAEIDGLHAQIQETMTAQQMQAISAMILTPQDVFKLVQEQGLGMGQLRQNNTNNSSTQSNAGFAPPEGGMAGGPPEAGMEAGALPDGSFGDMSGAGSGAGTSQGQTTVAASGGESPSGVPTVLLDALIQYLEQIASA